MGEILTNNTEIIKLVKEESLTKTEKKIFTFIKYNPKKTIKLSLKEISNEIEVSGGSVLNFCRNILNLEGFSELKIQLAEDLSKSDSLQAVFQNPFFERLEIEHQELYQKIKKDIDEEKIINFKEMIDSANRIIIFDTENGGLARTAASMFYEIKYKNVSFIDNINFGLKKIYDLKTNDVLFILSLGDEKVDFHDKIFEASNSKIISIVNSRMNSYKKISDLSFISNINKKQLGIKATITYLNDLLSYLDFKQ